MAKLPHYSSASALSASIEPVYPNLFEMDFNCKYLNSLDCCFKAEFKNKMIEFHFNDERSLDITKINEHLEKVPKIVINQHDKTGEVFRKITAYNIRSSSMSFSLDYSADGLSVIKYSVECELKFDIDTPRINKKFGL